MQLPSSGIEGGWFGTWVDGIGDCKPLQARAFFSRDGASVSGQLSSPYKKPCGMGVVVFQGSLHGTELTGTMTGSLYSDAVVTAHGELSGQTLDFIYDVYRPSGLPPFPGHIQFHR